MKKCLFSLLMLSSSLFSGVLAADEPSYFIFGDFLYWNANEENLDFVIYTHLEGSQPPFAPTTFPDSLSSSDQFFPGCRVGAGYREGWSLAAIWTYFYSKKIKNSNSEAAVGFFLSDKSNPFSERAHGQWKLHFNVLDVEANYPVVFNCFELVPHVGFRSAWIKQKIEVAYDDVFFLNAPSFPRADYLSLNRNDFWGIGLRSGLDNNWHFWKDFGFYAKSGISLLTGRFNVSRNQLLQNTVSFEGTVIPAGTTRAQEKRLQHLMVAAADIAAGLDWTFIGKTMDLVVSLGWEVQIWFSQNQMFAAQSDIGIGTRHTDLKGNLTLHGLTARADFSF